MARVQAVLDELSASAAAVNPTCLPEGAGTLDRRLAEAARGDLADLCGGVLGVLGRINLHGAPDGYREVTVCTWFGHVSFRCAYYGPVPARESRQVRRRLEREQKDGDRRRRKNDDFPRKGGSPGAYPLLNALNVRTPPRLCRTRRGRSRRRNRMLPPRQVDPLPLRRRLARQAPEAALRLARQWTRGMGETRLHREPRRTHALRRVPAAGTLHRLRPRRGRLPNGCRQTLQAGRHALAPPQRRRRLRPRRPLPLPPASRLTINYSESHP